MSSRMVMGFGSICATSATMRRQLLTPTLWVKNRKATEKSQQSRRHSSRPWPPVEDCRVPPLWRRPSRVRWSPALAVFHRAEVPDLLAADGDLGDHVLLKPDGPDKLHAGGVGHKIMSHGSGLQRWTRRMRRSSSFCDTPSSRHPEEKKSQNSFSFSLN